MRTCTGDGSTPSGQWDGTAPQCPRMFYYCNWSYHMIMYTHSCGLWEDSSVYYQWISWDTNNHNIHRDSATAVMMAMHSLGMLQVLVRQMQPGADHQNAEVHTGAHCHCCAHHYMGHTLTRTGITISGIQSGAPILIGGSVTITCTTDSPADSIMLLQDDEPLHDSSSVINHHLTYTISLVTDSIHRNTFKCEALLTGRIDPSDTAFDMVTISIEGKSINAYGYYY